MHESSSRRCESQVVSDNLDEESAQIRDVYAHYGLAMYLAQCLEHGIVLALVYAKLLPQVQSETKAAVTFSISEFERRFDIFMDDHFELTMGGLISRLRTSSKLADALDTDLSKAKESRNFLAHRYFRERAAEFISKVGRNSMLAELQHAQQLFERVDEELKTATNSLAQVSGVSLTNQEQRVAKHMAQAYARAASLDATAQTESGIDGSCDADRA